MKTKKLLSIISAAAITVTALSGSMLTVNAEGPNYGTAEVMDGGGTRLTIVSNDSVTHGSGGIEEDGDLGSTHVDKNDQYLEITLPAISVAESDSVDSYDTVAINMGTANDAAVDIKVKIGDTVVAEIENHSTGSWDTVSKELPLNENYTGANKAENVTLYITHSADSTNNYCGNYKSVEFYNKGAEREAEIAAEAFDIDEVVTARKITRTESADRFGTLSNMAVTSEENYPSVFGAITDYTECCDFTSGDDYYYVSVAEAGSYSFAILAEGNGKTNLGIEEVNGTEFEKVVKYNDISWTEVGNCYYVGSNGSAEERNLYTHTTFEVELQQGLYKVTFSPAEGGNDYYCDLIAIAGISASEPDPEPEPTQPTADLETANWSVEGSDTGYDVNQNKLTVDGEDVFGYKATFSDLGSTTYTTVKATVKKADSNETKEQTKNISGGITLNDGGVVFYIISNAELDTTGSSIVLE